MPRKTSAKKAPAKRAATKRPKGEMIVTGQGPVDVVEEPLLPENPSSDVALGSEPTVIVDGSVDKATAEPKPPIPAEKPVELPTSIIENPDVDSDERLRILRLKVLRKEKRKVRTPLEPEALQKKSHEAGGLVKLINDENLRLAEYTKAAKGRIAEHTTNLYAAIKAMDEGDEREMLCEVRLDEPGNHLWFITPEDGRIVASALSFKGDKNRWESVGVVEKGKKTPKSDPKAPEVAKTPSGAASEAVAQPSADSGGLVPVLDGVPTTDPAPETPVDASTPEPDPFVDPETVSIPTSRKARNKPDDSRVDRFSSPEFWLLHESGKLDPTSEDEDTALSELEGFGSEPATLTTAIGKANDELDAFEGDLCSALRRSARARTAVNAGFTATKVADVDTAILEIRLQRAVIDVAAALLKVAEDLKASADLDAAVAAEGATA